MSKLNSFFIYLFFFEDFAVDAAHPRGNIAGKSAATF